MRYTMHVLNASGDLTLAWDPKNEDETAKARAEVEALKAAGYAFFLADGQPADEVTAGEGTLTCKRRIDPVELFDAPAASEAEAQDPPEAEAPKRRGKPKAQPAADAAPSAEGQTVVAVRPLRGG